MRRRYRVPCTMPGKLNQFTAEIDIIWDPNLGDPAWRLNLQGVGGVSLSFNYQEFARFKQDLASAVESIRRLKKHPLGEGHVEEEIGSGITIEQGRSKASWHPLNPGSPLEETDIVEVIRGLPGVEAAINEAISAIRRLAQ